MNKKEKTKVADLAPAVQKVILLKLAYIQSYRKLFGKHPGLRSVSVDSWLYGQREELFGASFDEVHGALHSHETYSLVRFAFRARNAAVEFENRFDVTGFEKELESCLKVTRGWVMCVEMRRVTKAVKTLQCRSKLPGFARKYPELKRALEKLNE